MARILVVDDNLANLDLMLYLLRAFGYECDGVRDAPAALTQARQHSYDLAIVDILMPGMDGCELARRVKSDPSIAGLPLVAVTALAMPDDRRRILGAGFAGYIPKPIDPERFVQQIEAHLGTERRTKQAPHERVEWFGTARTPRPGPVVLVVDDLQVNVDVVRASLAPFGFQVMEARSVNEALALLERTTPDAIVCDLHMPDEGGFDLIERVRANERWRNIPFAFLSSTAWQTRDRRRGIELGAQKFIIRPIDPQRLRKEIDEMITHGEGSHR